MTRGRHPTPSCTLPFSVGAQTLAFCTKGVNPPNNPVCLFPPNEPVGEGSWRKPGRLVQRDARPLVINPGSGSALCSDLQLDRHCRLPDRLISRLSLHFCSLSLPGENPLPPTFHPGARQCVDSEGAPQTCFWNAPTSHREDSPLSFPPRPPLHLNPIKFSFCPRSARTEFCIFLLD